MKRSGFKRPEYVKKPLEVTPIPPEVSARIRYSQTANQPSISKFPYVRDERLRDMCRGMACQHCGVEGEQWGITWAHSNQARHGKGKGVKASDEFCAAMCLDCHQQLDQGSRWTHEERIEVWTAAWLKTINAALKTGTWPPGLALPAEYVELTREAA